MAIWSCEICWALVDEELMPNHLHWHASLSPAPMREDHSGSSDVMAHAEIPGDYAYPERDPVAEHAEGTMPDAATIMHMANCDHDWPPELHPDTPCTKCGMPYDIWDKTMRHMQ